MILCRSSFSFNNKTKCSWCLIILKFYFADMFSESSTIAYNNSRTENSTGSKHRPFNKTCVALSSVVLIRGAGSRQAGGAGCQLVNTIVATLNQTVRGVITYTCYWYVATGVDFHWIHDTIREISPSWWEFLTNVINAKTRLFGYAQTTRQVLENRLRPWTRL